MHVKQLSLKHYRNYEELSLEFEPGIHLFIGDNAQGKTNFLEALHVLALAKSHRTSQDKQLITWNKDKAVLKGMIERKRGSLPLELSISKKGKMAKYNHIEQNRLSDYIGGLNVVLFAPEDLQLIKGSPQMRRRFLDMEIGQINSTYLFHLSRYYQLLSQRNALLKDWHNRPNQAMIDVFTVQLIEEAAKLIWRRNQYVRSLQTSAGLVHQQISKGKENLTLKYVFSAPLSADMTEEEIRETLTDQFDQISVKEQRRGTTLIGPHRDDLSFLINGRNVQIYGSQGQQRTAALSLKLAEIELIHDEIKEYPVLLLDDVLSELDDHRRTHLLQTMQNKVQTFVTNTSVEGIDRHTLRESFIYYVREGQITKKR